MGPTREKAIQETARSILNELKQDRENLLKKLDKNGDGQIDLKEWEVARKAARTMAREDIKEGYEPTQHHVLIKPFDDSNPYLISAYLEDELTRNYKLYSLGLLVLFLATGVSAVYMTIVRPGFWG